MPWLGMNKVLSSGQKGDLKGSLQRGLLASLPPKHENREGIDLLFPVGVTISLCDD